MGADYRPLMVALLTVWVLASPAGAADMRPTIGSRVRVQANVLGPGWHEGMFNATRTEPACYVIVFFKPRSSRTAVIELSSTIYVRNVSAHVTPERSSQFRTGRASRRSQLRMSGIRSPRRSYSR